MTMSPALALRLSMCLLSTCISVSSLTAGKWNTLTGEPTIYFAHRGEPALLPGHTLPAYEIAAIEGAEFVEPDLVPTKDGHLVCHHDVTLKRFTDVENHPEFDHLRTNYTGYIGDNWETVVNDYFVQDFTLAELKTLRVKQKRTGIRPRHFDGLFEIPTFHELLNLTHRMTITLNKTIGIAPELKHARFHNARVANGSESHFMEDLLLRDLESNGYAIRNGTQENCTGTGADYPPLTTIKCPTVIIQSFEKTAIDYLRTKTDLDLLLLVGPDVSHLTWQGMASAAAVAQWMCVWKEYIYAGVEKELKHRSKGWTAGEEDFRLNRSPFVPGSKLVEEAHRLGMKMCAFTIPDSRENSSWGCAVVPGCHVPNKRQELHHYFRMGLDGIFVENVPESREIRLVYEYEELGNPEQGFRLVSSGVSKSPPFKLMTFQIFMFCIIKKFY